MESIMVRGEQIGSASCRQRGPAASINMHNQFFSRVCGERAKLNDAATFLAHPRFFVVRIHQYK